MDTTARRIEEVLVYEDLYSDPDASYGYPQERQHVALEFAREALDQASSVFDVSAGRGQFARIVQERYPSIDVCVSEAVDTLLEHDLAGLPRHRWVLPEPGPEGSWDVVTCLDVMEHLVPEDTGPAIRAILDKASRHACFSVALFPCAWRGRETHINLRAAEEWQELLLVDGWTRVRSMEMNRVLWTLLERAA